MAVKGLLVLRRRNVSDRAKAAPEGTKTQPPSGGWAFLVKAAGVICGGAGAPSSMVSRSEGAGHWTTRSVRSVRTLRVPQPGPIGPVCAAVRFAHDC